MLNKLKKISARDVFGVFKFLLVLIPATVYGAYLRVAKKQMWLICEREDMARDNGLAFFEYMQKEHPELKTFYAIDKKNPDYKYVEKFKSKVVQWASLRHYFLYMSATRNISSHKEGNPNQTLFTILHLYLNLYNNRVFLQHGITVGDISMFYYKNAKFKKFVCGAKPEYEYICKNFGYPEGAVMYTGFARFDKLKDEAKGEFIAFVPTWRRWLNSKNIVDSDYWKNILEVINNEKLEKYLEKEKYTLLFYPHINAQKYFNESDISNKRVKLLKAKDIEIVEVLRKASVLITDYSSISFDFAYIKKPIVYIHFDDEAYYAGHIKKGYFECEKHGFGPVIYKPADLVGALEKANEKMYIERGKNFFTLSKRGNCKRIFEELIK